MAYSATVSQSGDGKTLTFTDTSTISGSLVSKVLVITDANGATLDTVSMGALTTATYAITADAYFTFTMTLIDGAGTHVVVENWLSVRFYINMYLKTLKGLGCGCGTTALRTKLQCAGQYYDAANDYAIFQGYGILSDTNIKRANAILNS